MGSYRVVRKLAAGGMAEVFLGKLVGTGGFEKPVAIKRMLPAVASDPKCAEAFLREARLCVHLSHPNVVQVLDLGMSGGLPYLVMELVDGPDLRRVLIEAQRAGRPLTTPEAVHIAASVAEALAYAFEAHGPGNTPLRIVHRDVNPTNVLLAMNGAVKLADFGVAKAADGREATQGNLVKGKLGYLAPELLSGVPAGHPSDIFLAGALLYEMLVGQPLFPTRGPAPQILVAISNHDEKNLRLPVGLAPELLPLLQRALARDPAARFGHAREFASALRSLIAGRGWKIGSEELSARLASLFPGRTPLDAELAGGAAVRDDGAQLAQPPRADERTQAAPAAAPAQGPRAAVPGTAPAEIVDVGRPRPRGHRRIGELMVEAGLITEGQLQHLLSRQQREGGRLGEWAVTLDYAPCRAVLELLARQLGTPFITDERILQTEPAQKLLARFPQEKALRLMAVPLVEKEGRVLVAMLDPADLARVDAISFTLGRRVQPVVCSEFGLRRALSRIYGGRSDEVPWSRSQAADPMSMLSSQMVDFDEGGHVRRISEEGEGALGLPAAPPASTSTTASARPAMPAPAGPPVISAVQVTPAPTMTPVSGVPVVAGGPTTPGGCAYAYVVAGVGPDGRPVFVPMALTPQGIPLSPQPPVMATAGLPATQAAPVAQPPAGPSRFTSR